MSTPSGPFRHILLPHPPRAIGYTRRGGGPDENPPTRDRAGHGAYLSRRLNEAWKESTDEQAVAHITRHGVHLEFKGEAGCVW